MRGDSRQIPRADRSRLVTRREAVLAPVTRGLGALYRGDARLTLNGLDASSWGDRASGLDVAQGTAASQPTTVPFAVGARTAIRFDGTNDQMSRVIATGLSPSARGLSVVFVAQGRSGSTGDFPAVVSARPWSAGNDAGWAISANGTGFGGSGANVLTAHYDSGVSEAGGFDHTDAVAQATRGLSTTQRELWCVVFDVPNSRLRYYRNGQIDKDSTVTFPTTSPIVPTADFRVGADRAVGVGTRFLAMDLFALAIHTEPLTAGEVGSYAAAWMPYFGVRP